MAEPRSGSAATANLPGGVVAGDCYSQQFGCNSAGSSRQPLCRNILSTRTAADTSEAPELSSPRTRDNLANLPLSSPFMHPRNKSKSEPKPPYESVTGQETAPVVQF
eukprot:2733979-Rhodomonas_salina.1